MRNKLEDILIQGAYFLVLTTGLVAVGYIQEHNHAYPESKTEQQKIYYVDEKYKEYKK